MELFMTMVRTDYSRSQGLQGRPHWLELCERHSQTLGGFFSSSEHKGEAKQSRSLCGSDQMETKKKLINSPVVWFDSEHRETLTSTPHMLHVHSCSELPFHSRDEQGCRKYLDLKTLSLSCCQDIPYTTHTSPPGAFLERKREKTRNLTVEYLTQ